MAPRTWYQVSLARKISLLFGAAVLLTISATLVFPWLQMSALNDETMLLRATAVATAAYGAVDLHTPNWRTAREQLERRWPSLAREAGLPKTPPKLVRFATEAGPGFQADAMEALTFRTDRRYYWRIQDDGRLFRYALAVRADEADRHPDVLRGIIDVRLPIQAVTGFWNSVVTVLAGASGAVLAILTFYLVTQRLVLTPLTALRSVAEQVTTGDIDVRSSIASGDEFQDLSDAFNEMLSSLRRVHDDLEKSNRSLDTRLGELAETNVALFESNRLKTEFLGNVTHELRTPLVSIIGFAELLRDAWRDPRTNRKRLAHYAENILASGRSLLEIINDLLDLAKIEAGKLELHISEFSIVGLCKELADFVEPLVGKKDQRLSLSLDDDLPRFKSDSGKIKQILYNLLSNAIKFTPEGGAISFSAERLNGDWVRMIVSDTGPGIPESLMNSVFEKFRQLDSSKTREYEGTGLGLAITKELVLMLGGTIRLESLPDQGATFEVHLPVSTRANEPRPRQSV